MASRKTSSFLQIQLGQEVIYLLLSFFAFLALALSLVVANQKEELASYKGRDGYDESGPGLRAHIKQLQDLIEKLRKEIERLTSEKTAAENASAEDKKETDRLRAENERLRAEIAKLKAGAAQSGGETKRLEDEAERLRQELEKLSRLVASLTDQQPMIPLPEADGYVFPLGGNGISADFEKKLAALIPDIIERADRYRANVIEVIGHTDEVKVGARASNLDSQLIPFLRGSGEGLVASDNTGLGMARAAAVVRLLIADKRLADKRYSILPLSAGQVIEPGDSLSAGDSDKDTPGRRRIEIRLRRK